MASRDTLNALNNLRKERDKKTSSTKKESPFIRTTAPTKRETKTSSKTNTNKVSSNNKASSKSNDTLKALDNLRKERKTVPTRRFPAVANPATVGNSPAKQAPLREKLGADYWQKRYEEVYAELMTKPEYANGQNPAGAHATAIVHDEMKRHEYIVENQDNTYKDNFFGQFAASYRTGDISERSTEAMADYLKTGNKADYNYSLELDELSKRIQENNKEVYVDDATLPWISQDVAGYLPQLFNQTVPQVIGGGVGGTAGAALTLLATKNPELALTGFKYGAKIGATAASGYDSYDRMRASAFKGLIELGADEETAKAAANDEAVLGAITEMGDTWFTLGKFGYGAVLNSLGKDTTKKAAVGGLKKLGVILGKYGLNIEQERAEEGIQGAISVANRRRVYNDITRKADEEIGQYGQGNIDLYNRPQYKYPDGQTATVESASFNIDGEIVLLPTIAYGANGNAVRLTDDEAFRRYVETGEYLGKFNTEEEAKEYAQKLHLAQDYYYSDNKDEYTDNGIWGLTKDAGNVLWGVDFGKEDKATIKEIEEQKRAGGAIAAVMGSLGTAVDVGASSIQAVNDNKIRKVGKQFTTDTEAVINDGLKTDPNSESHKIAQELKDKLDAGEKITNTELGRAVIATVQETQRENANNPATIEEAAEMVTRETDRTVVNPDVPHWVGKLPTLTETPAKTASTELLGDGERAVGVVNGQGYVSDGRIFLPVNNVDTAKTELGASESKRVGENVEKLLKSDFTAISEKPVEGNISGIGAVNVFTDDSGREIALQKDVAEHLEGYNLEATFRGGKPYAVKATDNDGNVAGIAMAVGLSKSESQYNITDAKPVTQNPSMADTQKLTGFGEHGTKAFADIVLNSNGNKTLVASEFNTAYRYGMLNAKPTTIDTTSPVQLAAFEAGLKDYNVEVESKKANVKNVISHGESAGFDRTNVPSGVSSRELDIMDAICKALGVRGRFVGKSDKYNANMTPNVGEIVIASDFIRTRGVGENARQVSVLEYFLEEAAGHRAKELAPEAYMAFEREMYSYLELQTGTSLADIKRKSYGDKGVDLSVADAIEEVMGESLFSLYGYDIDLFAEGLDRVLNGTNEQAKKGANVFKKALDWAIDKLNKVLAKFGKEIQRKYQPAVDEATRLRDAFESSLGKSVAKNKEIAAKQTSENLEIKTNKEYNGNDKYSAKTKYNEYNTIGMHWAYDSHTQVGDLNVLYNKFTGKYVLVKATKEDVGFIELRAGNFAQMRKEREYYATEKDRLVGSEETVDKVLRDFGIRRNNNDGDNVDVGNRGTGKRNAELSEGKSKSNKATDTQTAKGNLKFSLKDSDGNTLTKAQQEYFKDSKVRDENGNLKIVYHGTTRGGFTVFNRSYNWYTDNKETAQSYSKDDTLYEGYANITKPYVIDAKGDKWSGIAIDSETKALLEKYGSSTFRERGAWRTSTADIVAAISEAVEEGSADYDGVIILNVNDFGSWYNGKSEGIGNDYVTFSSEQFKNKDNENPTSHPDIRFNLKEPVEETKNLVALHNLSEEKLLKTLALGGFPMPSIAITKSDIPHTNFGDITLVMSKDTIDPKANKKNTVYSADAWTPVVPNIEYEVNPEAESRLRNKFYDLSRKYGRESVEVMYSYGNTLETQLNREGGAEGILARLKDDTRMMNVYLLDIGKEQVQNVYKEKVEKLSDAKIKEYDFIINGLGENVLNETFPPEGESPMTTRKKWLEAHGAELEKVYADYLVSIGIKEDRISHLMSEYGFTAKNLLQKVVLPARNYLKNGAEKTTREYDITATKEAIRNAVDTKAYEKWLQDNFGDVEKSQGIYNNKDYYMPSGKRRSFAQTHYPVTLENIVKAMTSQNDGNTKNVSGFVGIKTLRAGTAERFKSIADMHKRSDRLQHLTEAEAEAINDALSKRMTNIMSRVLEKSKHPTSNSYIELDSIGGILSEVAESGTYTIDNISKIFAKYDYNIGNTTATDIRDLLFDVTQMPVNIFEAKPERAVGFDEVLAAILPDSASDKLRTQLEQAGVNILTYESGNDADRLAKVNSVENAKFSLKGAETGISVKEAEKVGKAIASRDAKALAKYAESGAISTEFYNQLIETYGVIPKGEKPYRDVSVPAKTSDNKKVSQTVRTILEAKATPDEAVPTIQKMVEDGVFSYDTYTDKQAISDAESYIKEYGWDESLDDWFDAVEKGEVSKELTTMGWALYNNAANLAATTTSETERTTAIKTSLKILDAMVKHQRSAAQALQATRILKKMSPETQLYGVQKSVSAFQKELTDKYGDKAPDLKIDEDLAEQFLTAETQEERDAVEEKILKDIGRQMPARFIDKWNAWRYLAMLGNPRTHIKNIGGNAGFAPIVALKNLTATATESAVHRVSGKKTSRSKAFVGLGKADRALLKAAWDDYANVADMISNGGKYSDFAMANQQIEEGRRIFKFKPLEMARKGNSKALEMEDMWFSKPHYANALAQYCKANKITAEQLQKGKALGNARQYAIKEAQKATYRDTNAFSQMVSEWGRHNKNEKNVVKKAFNTVVEGILPFRKTPANILVRGVEYSPLGLLKGLSYDLVQVGKGKMTSAEAIDSISAGLTGTGLLALGIYLAAEGLIRGHGEDDEEKEFKEMMGHQAYALELPNGTSVTLDWLAPEALPFFVGVNIWETTSGADEEANLSTILQAVSGISEPMLEMSCLQSLNDVFESVGYASSNDTSGLVSVLSSAATSYLTQGLPTILGQAERTGEEERMTTYTEKNSFLTKDLQYTLGKASAKIPFWDYNQIPYIDAWGRKEASGTALERGLNNFLNPAYTSTIETSSMEKELMRLHEQTGEASVFPTRADKYFMVDGVRKDLTKEEYVRYATLKGQKSYKVVSDLVKSKAYKSLSNEEKVKAIEEAYDYANQKAKEAISKYKPETWVKNADAFGSNVGNYISFKAEVASTREANGDKISKQQVGNIILDMAQNDTETWNMYLSMYDSKGANYVKDNGVDGEKYVEFLDTLDEVDKPNENGKLGTYTNDEITEAIRNVPGISNKDRAVLWQSFKVDKSSKNNPWRKYLP